VASAEIRRSEAWFPSPALEGGIDGDFLQLPAAGIEGMPTVESSSFDDKGEAAEGMEYHAARRRSRLTDLSKPPGSTPEATPLDNVGGGRPLAEER